MIKVEDNGKTKIIFEFTSQGEHLVMIQKALLLGIECIGSHEVHSGYENHQAAVWILSDLLRACMLDDSQSNVALGASPYSGDLRQTSNS